MYGDAKPLQLLIENKGEVRVGAAFTPYWWVCDPCNGAARRYEVTFRAEMKPQGFAWYQVVTTDDNAEDIKAKLTHYRAVIVAAEKIREAQREWERLNGLPYPR
jgi:hypothetical protein